LKKLREDDKKKEIRLQRKREKERKNITRKTKLKLTERSKKDVNSLQRKRDNFDKNSRKQN